MTEILEVKQEPEQVVEQVQEKQYTEIELKAIDQGWIPKDDFDGDPSEFIDAPEFVRRGELFDKIEIQNKSIKRLEKALDAFKVHHTKVKEAEYNRALKALQDERRRLLVEGEHDRAFAIEDKIEEVKQEKEQVTREVRPEPVDDSYSVEFQNWVGRNGWYETDRVMRKAADALGLDYHNEGHAPADVLRMVERDIKAEFKHKFEKKQPVSTVESSTRSSTKSDTFKMTEDETRIMRQIVASGVMNEAEYIKELKRTR